MATRVTEKEKQEMWKLYQTLKSFKQVAKKMHRDPSTVSRYVHEYETAVRAASYIMSAKGEM